MLPFLLLLSCGLSFTVDAIQCPKGAISYTKSCYHFSHDTEPWYDAAGICERFYKGYLVEVNDPSENSFLIAQATNRSIEYWIGANDLQVEGEWKWLTSKTDVTTATWGAPPSNDNSDENCAEILNGAWNDDSCHKSQHYICEIGELETEIVG